MQILFEYCSAVVISLRMKLDTLGSHKPITHGFGGPGVSFTHHNKVWNGAWDLLIQNWFYKKSKGRPVQGQTAQEF